MGYASMTTNTTGGTNVAVGAYALTANTTASNNTAVGYQAGYSNTTGTPITVVGYQAGYSNTSGEIQAFGRLASYSNTTGVANSSFGLSALYANTTGSNNTAMGYNTLNANITGTGNVAVGTDAGEFATTADSSTFVGFQAGQGITGVKLTGNSNTAVGKDAGLLLQGAANANTLLGATAGDNITTGDSNIIIGNGIDAASATADGQLNIGGMIFGTGGASASLIGIGTDAPFCDLHVGFSDSTTTDLNSGAGVLINNLSTGTGTLAPLLFSTDSANRVRSAIAHVDTGGYGKGDLAFYTMSDGSTSGATIDTSDEAMRIDSSGNLLVGTTSTAKTSNGFRIEGGQANTSRGSGGDFMLFFDTAAGATVGTISNSGGSATAYNTSSDYRLKTDAQPMTGASARVQALNPVNFEWIASGARVDGFLAHEAQAVVPEAVTGTKDAMMDEEYEVTPAVFDEDGNETSEAVMATRSVPDYQGIDQSKLVPLLTAALQEALTKIDAMEARITALEGA
jgi:hypothetical protein